MASEDERRNQLLARVYSRTGQDEPRTEHVDPVTGEPRWASDSEWELLELEGCGATSEHGRDDTSARTGSRTGPAALADPPATPAAPAAQLRDRRRRRHPAVVVSIAAALAVAATSAAWSWWSSRSATVPAAAIVELSIAPSAPVSAQAGARTSGNEPARGQGTMAVFQDPDRSRGSLPGWLEATFPSSRVAQVLGPDGPVPGVGVYAVTTTDLVACLIVRIEARRMVWDCTAVRTLASEGLVMRTAIPAGLGSGEDPDGDGVSGDAAVTDVLVAEWHADGTFRVAREAG
ncbi:hypothetical protein [Agromyces bracchium]|uniref:Uncharacterized protein n=1 Tax=Agromyces bracchium TaxID=88376 RepID=A0A6I3M9C8_9MICO|nr:hypothetical protein [Agromyces bracchium]MTH68657.1 hypothetical protein [Agromyces bracchium]